MSRNDHESPIGMAAGSALPAKMDWASSARSMAMFMASRTRLSFAGSGHPSGENTHHMERMASSRRVWIGKPSRSISLTRSRLTSATSTSPRRRRAMRVVSSGTSRKMAFLYFGVPMRQWLSTAVSLMWEPVTCSTNL